MYPSTNYRSLLGKDYYFIDLRTPMEYEKATIPGAYSLPILTNEEYRHISTLYDRGQVEEAKKKGVELVSYKLPEIFSTILEKTKEKKVVLFCARGGYRSTVLFTLCRALHVDILKLDYGYKGYRQVILEELPKLVDRCTFINLNGLTGTGKTEILQELKSMGQVLDLEELANHRGSLLGGLGKGPQPGQKMFESLIFEKLLSFEEPTVFVESESSKIGNLYVPQVLYKKYKESPHQIKIRSSREKRIQRIHQDYLPQEDEAKRKEALACVRSMERYINPKKLQHLLERLEQGEVDWVIGELMEKYYDKSYSIGKGNMERVYDNEDSKETALKIGMDYL